jgi:hypothetical protein
MKDLIQAVPGAQKVFDWFGAWPSFHDAEVVGLQLNRTGPSKVCVHTFRMTNEINPQGFYKTEKHCLVTFLIDEITAVQLNDFNHQNVLFGLTLNKENGEFVLSFNPSYGLEGNIRAKTIRVELAPGVPDDSQYKKYQS